MSEEIYSSNQSGFD